MQILNRAWSALLTSLCDFAWAAVWLGLSGVYGSSDVWVCMVDDSM